MGSDMKYPKILCLNLLQVVYSCRLCLGVFRRCVWLRVLGYLVPGSCVVVILIVVVIGAHDAKLTKTAAIDDLSYLTYFPLPLSISWYRSQNLSYRGCSLRRISSPNMERTSRSML